METGKENSSSLDLTTAKSLADHRRPILDALMDLEDSKPKSKLITEIEDLGGIGTFGMSLGIIKDLSDRESDTVRPSTAKFIVAFLNSSPIQSFIVKQTKGEITLVKLTELRDFFLEKM